MTTKLKYFLALNRALHEEMSRDERVILIGEDIGESGGIFSQTRGIYDKFGPNRVRDTPIAEGGFVSMCVGAAAAGLRPIIEIGFEDFVTACMDSIVNQAAKLRYMLGGQVSVPIVLYTFGGGGLSAGPQHSQSFASWFAHVPGLKVVTPSTPRDVLGLFKSAVRDNNPTLCLLGKQLIGSSGIVPNEDRDFLIPIGKSEIKKEGTDVSLVTFSQMVPVALKAAEQLESKHKISMEVIDLRTISPLDIETIISSIKKTKNLCVLQEAMSPCSVASEVLAQIAEYSTNILSNSPIRICPPFTPSPFAPQLEKVYLPDENNVISKVLKMISVR